MFARLVMVSCILGSALALAAGAAAAQDGAPVRVRGQVAGVDGRTLTVQARDGATERVELAADATILGVVPAELHAIVPGTFVGTAAVPQPDGRFTALEVVVFPETMRGAGEGRYAWDLTPESTMTNATVHAAEAEANGRVLTLRYPEGETTVVVPEDAPVVGLEPGDASLLRPGSHVFVPAAARGPDGTLSAKAIAVGKDGLVPPM
ncbi:MAG TPA: hypothetical protein VFY87_07975 [Geminicoccaceae bacterium]|nr:hypothetical protein [Geminicoccaceae bacterium]